MNGQRESIVGPSTVVIVEPLRVNHFIQQLLNRLVVWFSVSKRRYCSYLQKQLKPQRLFFTVLHWHVFLVWFHFFCQQTGRRKPKRYHNDEYILYFKNSVPKVKGSVCTTTATVAQKHPECLTFPAYFWLDLEVGGCLSTRFYHLWHKVCIYMSVIYQLSFIIFKNSKGLSKCTKNNFCLSRTNIKHRSG